MTASTPYTHLSPDWPRYRWDHAALAPRLADLHFRRGALVTAMAALGFDVRQEAVLGVLVQDITKSSAIEGEHLDAEQVRSSVAQRLGIDVVGLPVAERRVEGVVEMMLDATQRYDAPLDEERIFGWHAALFPTGRSGLQPIVVGAWRKGEMRVVSGPEGRHRVHFEAPEADRVPGEMARLLGWFEGVSLDPVLKAALAHLWFVTIHPLDDGNGRIGRAIMDMALARADGTERRFYSMTAQIYREKRAYHDILERTQKESMDVTPWMGWFLDRMGEALDSAEGALEIVRAKQAFWDQHRETPLNERQIRVLNLLLEGFRGKLQTAKYAKIVKTSNDTALRDLTDLVGKGILVREEGGGRNTSYVLSQTSRKGGGVEGSGSLPLS